MPSSSCTRPLRCENLSRKTKHIYHRSQHIQSRSLSCHTQPSSLQHHRPRIPCSNQHKTPQHTSNRTFSSTSSQAATLIRRPHRPYTFTQLITLSDGSTYTQRTTSPLSVYKSTKDIRNTPLWNPSSQQLANVEEDTAGRLRTFRRRFGRGWDAGNAAADPEQVDGGTKLVEGDVREGKEKLEGETVVDGVAVRVEASPEVKNAKDSGDMAGRKKDNKSQTVKSDSTWSQEQDDNLMDLIGLYGNAEGVQRDMTGRVAKPSFSGGQRKK